MNTQDKSKLSPGAADLINARAARRAGDWLGVYDVARCCQSNANSSLVGAGLAL